MYHSAKEEWITCDGCNKKVTELPDTWMEEKFNPYSVEWVRVLGGMGNLEEQISDMTYKGTLHFCCKDCFIKAGIERVRKDGEERWAVKTNKSL